MKMDENWKLSQTLERWRSESEDEKRDWKWEKCSFIGRTGHGSGITGLSKNPTVEKGAKQRTYIPHIDHLMFYHCFVNRMVSYY